MKFLNLFRQSRSCLSIKANRRILAPSILGYRFQSMAKENENLQYEVCINTCGLLYERWREEKRFPTVPTGNLNFKVNYVDTHKNLSLNWKVYVPTVVVLHGAPGSYQDFASLTSYLHQNGARVVVPSFPGNPGVFRHTAEEKAQFVKDFLQALSISRIDTLVVHSSAVYTGLQLCLDDEPLVKSFVMLNPGTYTYDMKVTQGLKYLRMVVKASEVPIVFKNMAFILPSVFRLLKLPVRLDNFLDPLLSATILVHENILKAKQMYLQLSKSGLPMLYAFSDDDKLVEKTCSYNLANLLGTCNSDIYVYDINGCIKQNGKETSTLKVLAFENGSHSVFWKYSDIINKEIGNFVKKIS